MDATVRFFGNASEVHRAAWLLRQRTTEEIFFNTEAAQMTELLDGSIRMQIHDAQLSRSLADEVQDILESCRDVHANVLTTSP